MGDRWKSPVSGEPPVWHTLGHGLVTAQQSLGSEDTRLQVLSCQDPRRPRLGRGCSLLLCSTRPPETDPSPPSHHQWGHPVASAAGQSVKGPSREAEASTGSHTSRVYKRPEAARPTFTNAMMARLRPAAGIPKLGAGRHGLGVFSGETCWQSFFGRFGVFRWM